MKLGKLARVVAALEKRQRRAEFSLERVCFPEQARLVRSKAKRRMARLPRRTGKTTSAGGLLLDGAITPPFANQLYVTLSLKNARRLVWPVLKRLNREYGLGGVANETEAYMRFPKLPNEPHIFLGGVANAEEVEKIRGIEGGLKRAIVDEAQSMRPSIIQGLIDDAIEPSLMDHDGELIVLGTPGPVRAGYFYDIDEGKLRDGWEHHFWTLHANVFLQRKAGKSADQLLAELRERRKWTEDNPTYQREYLGQWVRDDSALVFRYGDANDFDALPPLEHFVLGVDLGYDDADAIAALGWSSASPDLYLAEEHVERKAGLTELGQRLTALRDRYHPVKIVVDAGGLGKKIAEELRRRWGIAIEAADKARKFEHIELVNDALRTGRLRARRSSKFAEDCNLVTWDADARAKGVLKISDAYHSDICDAVLYAFRAASHWTWQPAPPKPSDEDRIRSARAKRAAQIERRKSVEWWEADADEMGFGD